MDEDFLKAAPALKAIFYAGGTVRYFATEALWARGVRLTTAQAINAIPVSEFAASAILLGLKRFWHHADATRRHRTFASNRPLHGAYGSRVGLLSYGIIARQTRARLRALEIEVLVYDPYLDETEAAAEGIRKVSLDDLFSACDVVSVHTPLIPETVGLVGRRQLERMKPGAVFLNTARGEIVNEPELIAVLTLRPDLQAVLDVTAPEPPLPDSPLYTLPNVVLTPHIAGSVGPECLRMGHAMADEFERYRAGADLRWEISVDRSALLA